MTQLEPTQKPATIQQYIKLDSIRESAERTLGTRGQQFLTTILTLANSSPTIAECEPRSLYNACLTAATLDLPINQNLGFAYIVPYYNNKTKVKEAQFQMGYKGFVQLAIRSGKFKGIGVNPVCEGQLTSYDDFSGEAIFNFNEKTSNKIEGYMAYFELTNGFRKTAYMSIEELEDHAKKYSQTYKKGFGVWKDNFDAMGKKTVIKLLLSKFAPLSTQMEQALVDDQKAVDEYVDNKITFETEDLAIEGEPIDVQSTETDYLDEPVDPEPADELIELKDIGTPVKTKPTIITQAQLKKAFAIINNLPEEMQEIAEEGRLTLFGDKSRSSYTRDEASKWLDYLASLETTNE